jgi:hypothetical protein
MVPPSLVVADEAIGHGMLVNYSGYAGDGTELAVAEWQHSPAIRT